MSHIKSNNQKRICSQPRMKHLENKNLKKIIFLSTVITLKCNQVFYVILIEIVLEFRYENAFIKCTWLFIYFNIEKMCYHLLVVKFIGITLEMIISISMVNIQLNFGIFCLFRSWGSSFHMKINSTLYSSQMQRLKFWKLLRKV